MKRGRDFIGVGIGAVIINREGKIFLSQRGIKSQNERGKWECPGGALEFGETFEQTVVREMKEEFDIVVKPLFMLDAFNHLIPREGQHWVALCFVCQFVSGIPKRMEPEKSARIGWFTLSEADKMNLGQPARKRIEQLKEKYPGGLSKFYSK